jgi:four helix bundle protein
MRDFQKFAVWQKAHALTLEVYRATSPFPSHERYGLTSQLRRSSGSIAPNIAEGCGRETDSDFKRMLTIAAGSASESQYHILLARDLGYLDASLHSELDRKVVEVKRMLTSLIRRLSADSEADR